MPLSHRSLLLLLAALPACAGSRVGPLPLAVPAEGPRLNPGDAVRVVIEGEPALSGEFAVDEKGVVLLPLVGVVAVADRPFAEVRRSLLDAYGRELVTPGLLITPVLRIAVLGEVRQPGLIPVDPTFSVADVVAAAGGWSPAARRDRLLVWRGERTFALDLADGGGGHAGVLRSGDRIEVGRQSWVRDHSGTLLGASATVVAAAVTSLLLR